jgi:hypothetical protein
MKIDFIKEILMSTDEYWIVAKETSTTQFFETKRGDDQIIFIAIPSDIKRGLKYEDITLKEIEKLHNSYVNQNIFINLDYPPFQTYISFSGIYKGYPVNYKIKEFLINCFALKSNQLYDYKDLIQIEPTIKELNQ